MENPPKKFFRLSPGTEVRLRYAYFITCREVVKNAAGEVVELRCTYDPATKGGNAPDGRKVKATHALGVGGRTRCPPKCGSTIRCSREPDPERRQFCRRPQSEFAGSHRRRARRAGAWPATNAEAPPCSSSARAISAPTRIRRRERLVFNRTVGLRDTWAKVVRRRLQPDPLPSGIVHTTCAHTALAMAYTPR